MKVTIEVEYDELGGIINAIKEGLTASGLMAFMTNTEMPEVRDATDEEIAEAGFAWEDNKSLYSDMLPEGVYPWEDSKGPFNLTPNDDPYAQMNISSAGHSPITVPEKG